MELRMAFIIELVGMTKDFVAVVEDIAAVAHYTF
jgi:hypothetical protein